MAIARKKKPFLGKPGAAIIEERTHFLTVSLCIR
jgi:hypothetical protein